MFGNRYLLMPIELKRLRSGDYVVFISTEITIQLPLLNIDKVPVKIFRCSIWGIG